MHHHPACLLGLKCLAGNKTMQEYFYQLADYLSSLLHVDEVYTCNFSAEDSDFVRFNRSAVRQAGTVSQRYFELDLIRGQRHSEGTVSLSGDLDVDRSKVRQVLETARARLPYLPEDPH